MTVILYLNDAYSGGKTRIGLTAIEPRTGTALVFPHELCHEGEAVTSGTKIVLRTDVMFRAAAGTEDTSS